MVDRKLGVLAVDLFRELELDPHTYAYSYGGVQKGVERVKYFIDEVVDAGIPLWAVAWEMEHMFYLREKASPSRLFYKGYADSFEGTDLRSWLDFEGITDLFVLGFHKAVCVLRTVETASKFYRPVISDTLLFSSQMYEGLCSQDVWLKYKQIPNSLCLETFEEVMDYVGTFKKNSQRFEV